MSQVMWTSSDRELAHLGQSPMCEINQRNRTGCVGSICPVNHNKIEALGRTVAATCPKWLHSPSELSWTETDTQDSLIYCDWTNGQVLLGPFTLDRQNTSVGLDLLFELWGSVAGRSSGLM